MEQVIIHNWQCRHYRKKCNCNETVQRDHWWRDHHNCSFFPGLKKWRENIWAVIAQDFSNKYTFFELLGCLIPCEIFQIFLKKLLIAKQLLNHIARTLQTNYNNTAVISCACHFQYTLFSFRKVTVARKTSTSNYYFILTECRKLLNITFLSLLANKIRFNEKKQQI